MTPPWWDGQWQQEASHVPPQCSPRGDLREATGAGHLLQGNACQGDRGTRTPQGKLAGARCSQLPPDSLLWQPDLNPLGCLTRFVPSPSRLRQALEPCIWGRRWWGEHLPPSPPPSSIQGGQHLITKQVVGRKGARAGGADARR